MFFILYIWHVLHLSNRHLIWFHRKCMDYNMELYHPVLIFTKQELCYKYTWVRSQWSVILEVAVFHRKGLNTGCVYIISDLRVTTSKLTASTSQQSLFIALSKQLLCKLTSSDWLCETFFLFSQPSELQTASTCTARISMVPFTSVPSKDFFLLELLHHHREVWAR